MNDTWYFHTHSEEGLKRAWLRYKKFETRVEVALKKKVAPGFQLHFGNRGSETPIDWHVSAYWLAIFGSFNAPGLGAFCEKIGRGHKRNISLRTHDKTLWWELWYDDDMGYDDWHRCDKWRKPKLWPWSMGRKKHRSWMCLRHGNIELNPVSAFYGSRLWLKDETFEGQTEQAMVDIQDFPGDMYVVDFALERRQVRREHGPAWARRVVRTDYSADAKCTPGIPVRNHDWKGDEILGWSVRVSKESLRGGKWIAEAVQGTIDHVRRDRKHYNYHPPKEVQDVDQV
jgi:hypothetical protein